MNPYVIFTDSGCDILPALLTKWGVRYCNLTFKVDNSEKEYTFEDISHKEFYDRMREGHLVKTAAVNSEAFREAFEEELSRGNDVLYLGLSGGLSSTCKVGQMVAESLKEKYPARKILAVDTLSASAGLGLLIWMTVQKKEKGATIEEAAEFAAETRGKIAHWFTVDDLIYLKRGGRISSAMNFFGSALGIKPILHASDEGKAESVSKVRGRKNAMIALANKYGETAVDPTENPVFLTHGDCLKDVEILKELLVERYGARVGMVSYHGAVTGAYGGPGVIGMFFLAKER